MLIGIRGSGKSSLAILAATANSRRLVDLERAFLERTGYSIASHRKAVGISEHHRRHRQVLQDVLQDHTSRCVIVCNFADLEHGGHAMLRKFAETHPVIHIVRDVKGVQRHVRVWTEEKTALVLAVSGRLLRACSNFEFFNQSEGVYDVQPGATDGGERVRSLAALLGSIKPTVLLTLDQNDEDSDHSHDENTPRAPFLTLKRAERDFLKFLRLVMDHTRLPHHQSAYPLSQVSVEERMFTYAATVAAADVLAGNTDLEALQIGADAVQIVYDQRKRDPSVDIAYMMGEAFSIVRRATILPVILQINTIVDGVNSASSDNYVQMLHQALRFAPEYMVLSLDLDDFTLAGIVSLKGNTKIIGWSSVVERLPAGWDDPECFRIYSRANRLGCDIVQLTSRARAVVDNRAAQSFRHRIATAHADQAPLIAYNVGALGRASQCFNPVLTPVFASAASKVDQTLANVSAQQATQALFGSFVLEPMRYYIFGANVSYSLSPAMHSAAYRALGLPHNIKAWSATSLDDLQDILRQPDFGGTAIAQPWKVEAINILQSLSPHAKAIGAINSIIPIRADAEILRTGKSGAVFGSNRSGTVTALHGDNTDWIGIRAGIRRGLSPINTVRPNSSALVVGAGGMARASIYAFRSLGVRNIFIYNRTFENAKELANYYNSVERLPVESGNDGSGSSHTRSIVRVIRSIGDPWPEGFRLPTIIVCSIPQKRINEATAANFTLPPEWLRSPSGGVVIEVRCLTWFSVDTTNTCTACIQAIGYAACSPDPRRSTQRVGHHGRSGYGSGTGICSVRAFHRPQSTETPHA